MVRTLIPLVLLAGTAAAQPALRLLGTLPGTTPVSDAFGVSDDGSTVIGRSGSSFYYGSSSHGFRWSDDSGMVDLDDLAPESAAWAISGDGSATVGHESSTGSTHAYIWDAAGPNTLYHGGAAYAISRDASVIAGATVDHRGDPPHAGVITPDHSHVFNIDDPAIHLSSQARGVSAGGDVVVGWVSETPGRTRAFRWTSDGGLDAFGPAGIGSEALSVSEDGAMIVGDITNPGQPQHAALWRHGALTDLGLQTGSPYSVAYAVSADGSTIVGARGTSASGPLTAWVWHEGSGVQDLSATLGLPSGVALSAAHAVSANGRFIVGAARNAAGSMEAFLADTQAAPPCHADFNADGFLDFFDYDQFVDCFETGACPAGTTADFNGDGFQDFFDYDEFVTAFESGC